MLGIIGVIFMALIVWLYITEYQYFDNTLHVKKLLAISAAIGAGTGVLIGVFFARHDKKDKVSYVQTLLFFLFTGLICLPIFAVKSNRIFANNTPVYHEFTFIKQVPIISKPLGMTKFETLDVSYYLVYLMSDDEGVVRLKSKKEWIRTKSDNKPIILPAKKGYWGYEIVILPENQPENVTI